MRAVPLRAGLLTALGLSSVVCLTALGAPVTQPSPLPLGADHSIDSADRRPRIESNVAVDPRDPRRLVVSAIQLSGSYTAGQTAGYGSHDATWTSTDAGATFRANGPLPPQAGGVPAGNDPTLAWDPHGPLYASYTSFSSPNARDNTPGDGLYVARSLDGGRHWERRAHLEGFQCSGPDRSTITVDPLRGWIYVTWTHYVESGCNGSPDFARTITRWARSTDQGAHFSRPVDVTTDGASATVAPAVLPDGTVLVAYLAHFANSVADPVCHGFTGALQVVRFRPDGARLGESTADAHLCSTTLGLSPNGAAFLQMLFPSLAVNPATGTVVAAVIDDRAEAHGVAVATSRDGSRWTSTFLQGVPGTTATMPAVAAAPRGGFAIGWLEVAPGGAFTAVLAASRNGINWSGQVPLATLPSLGNAHPESPFDGLGFGHYLGLAVGRDGVAHLAWPDLRPHAGDPTDTDIWIRSARLP